MKNYAALVLKHLTDALEYVIAVLLALGILIMTVRRGL